MEFRGGLRESSLWASVYVYRLLSVLAHPSVQDVPDERDEFLKAVRGSLDATENYLIRHWHAYKWAPGNDLPWQEGATGVLSEVGPFLRREQTLMDCYDALRSLLTPAGRPAVRAKHCGRRARRERASFAAGLRAAIRWHGIEWPRLPFRRAGGVVTVTR